MQTSVRSKLYYSHFIVDIPRCKKELRALECAQQSSTRYEENAEKRKKVNFENEAENVEIL